jgi:ABC-2 type transport system ATP-binding protein
LYDANVSSSAAHDSPLLRVLDIRKRYGPVVALDGVSLSIARGELFGLLGPNGAGKTTLLSIVAGLLSADSGSVSLDEKSVSPNHYHVRADIGFAPQDLALYPELSARENLQFFGRLYRLTGKELDQRIEAILAAVQLSDRASDRAGTFSGGMKRRLNLALAVVHQPKILFLDEPTTGVDPQSRNAIFEEVRRLNGLGTTIVYTSHYMEEVQALCPRVGIIDAGKLIRCDALSELLKLDTNRIRFNADSTANGLGSRLRELPAVGEVTLDSEAVELTTADPPTTLPALIGMLRDLGITPVGMELRPPTLERVFLKLTGHALRD